MNMRLMAVPLFGIAALLAACDNHHDDSSNGTFSADFSQYVQALIAKQTCETTTPADISNINFTFDASQDSAEPIDVSDINPACSA